LGLNLRCISVVWAISKCCGHHKVVKATDKAFKSLEGIPKETETNHGYLILKANFVHENIL